MLLHKCYSLSHNMSAVIYLFKNMSNQKVNIPLKIILKIDCCSSVANGKFTTGRFFLKFSRSTYQPSQILQKLLNRALSPGSLKREAAGNNYSKWPFPQYDAVETLAARCSITCLCFDPVRNQHTRSPFDFALDTFCRPICPLLCLQKPHAGSCKKKDDFRQDYYRNNIGLFFFLFLRYFKKNCVQCAEYDPRKQRRHSNNTVSFLRVLRASVLFKTILIGIITFQENFKLKKWDFFLKKEVFLGKTPLVEEDTPDGTVGTEWRL